MTTCPCGTDCRAIVRADALALGQKYRRLVQVCDLCGWTEPASGMCTGHKGAPCGHYPPASTWRSGSQTPRGTVATVLHAEDRSSADSEAVA